MLGLAGGAAAGVAGWLSPVLIVLSLLILGRSFYVLYVQKKGTRFSTAITWGSAVFVAGYWTYRLL